MSLAIADGSLAQRMADHMAAGGLLGCTAVDRVRLAGVREESEEAKGVIRAKVTIDPSQPQATLLFEMEQDPAEAAKVFMAENGLPEEHLKTITAFVERHQVQAAVDKKLETPAALRSARSRREAETRGVLQDHAYDILAATTGEDGAISFEVWNPWGTGVPQEIPEIDRLGDGKFRLSSTAFFESFDALHWALFSGERASRVRGEWSATAGTRGGCDWNAAGQFPWLKNSRYELVVTGGGPAPEARGALDGRRACVVCDQGHPMIPNQQIVGKSFPEIRMYGECDLCETRGCTHRCSVGCDYDMCLECHHAQSLAAPAAAQVEVRLQLVLWQTDQRQQGKKTAYSPIGFNVFTTEGKGDGKLGVHIAQSKLIAGRSVSMDESLALQPGTYVIVPCMHTDETEAAFALDAHVLGPGTAALRLQSAL